MAKRGLGKGLGAFFGEEVTTTKENAAEKVSRSERKEHLMANQGPLYEQKERWRSQRGEHRRHGS